MKLKPKDPAKYDALSKTEMREHLVKNDAKEFNEKWMTAQGEARLLRMGAAGGAAVLTGILYEVKPDLENLAGTPCSLDHLLALGFAVGAYASKDEDTANACEGISLACGIPLARKLGKMIGGYLPASP